MAPTVAVGKIPNKLFFRIQEVSKITGVKPHVLRYWETEFPQLSPRKDLNDQRRYTKADIGLVMRIKRLLYEERYTIVGAKRCLRRQSNRKAISQAVEVDSLRALRRDIDELLSLLDNRPAAAA